ncbi:MAG: penicillin-binding protein 2 [Parcubacteria group bacterium]|nr:penicillin-binding protein 2 [Parcubacteria group bacterium]
MTPRSRRNYREFIPQKRLYLVIGVVFVFGALLSYRLASLQILRAAELSEQATRQHGTVRSIAAARGKIFIGEHASGTQYPIATNRAFSQVYLVPKDVTDPEAGVRALLDLVVPYGITEDTLRYRLAKPNDIYEPLLHKLSSEQLAPFTALGIPGLGWEPEEWRYYPEGAVTAHLTGFVGVAREERVGQYGLEGFFESELKGADGVVSGATDVSGRLIQTAELERKEPESGIDLVLTIDRTLQTYACRKLAERVAEVGAASGTAIIVDPASGAVLVMCASPSFDPNAYSEVSDIGVYQNPAVASAYEPGSIFKPFTMAAALNEAAITPQTTYVDEGFVIVGEHRLNNFDGNGRGEVDMVTVLEQSLNTGAVFVQQRIGPEKFRDYAEAFGFGSETGIELPNELSGNTSSLEKRGDIWAATASFGQGITVTPLQIVMAYAALANDGTLMKPYIIKEKRRGDSVISVTNPSVASEAVHPRTATVVAGMLVSVVREGYDNHGGVPGYYLAGKTGTAQLAEGGVYGQATIHSFAGFGPVDSPRFAMLIKLDQPRYGRFASSTAAPVFGDIAKFIMQYYEVPPDEAL